MLDKNALKANLATTQCLLKWGDRFYTVSIVALSNTHATVVDVAGQYLYCVPLNLLYHGRKSTCVGISPVYASE